MYERGIGKARSVGCFVLGRGNGEPTTHIENDAQNGAQPEPERTKKPIKSLACGAMQKFDTPNDATLVFCWYRFGSHFGQDLRKQKTTTNILSTNDADKLWKMLATNVYFHLFCEIVTFGNCWFY